MATDPSLYSPLQVNAVDGILHNQGLAANTAFTAALNSYISTIFTPLIQTVAIVGTGGSVQAGSPPGASPAIMTPEIASKLLTLGATTCPALGDSIPAAYAASWPAVLMSTLVGGTANTYMGNGDLSKFCQAVSTAQSYAGITNQVINTAVNSQTYLGT
jgi:hypothetical protein